MVMMVWLTRTLFELEKISMFSLVIICYRSLIMKIKQDTTTTLEALSLPS
jgi:hypothetical protein